MRRGIGLIALGLLLWGCSGSGTTPPGNECKEGERKCDSTGTKEIVCVKTTTNALRWGNPSPCAGGGKCENGTCVAACGDCNTPPDTCYASPGTCWNSQCKYDPVADGQSCDDKDDCTEEDSCQSGACKGKTKICNTPPTNTCRDTSSLTVYTAPGICGKGTCVYSSADVTCPMGCDTTANICKGDPCKGVTCKTPPSECHKAEGNCVNGSCSYIYDDGKICDDKDSCTISDKCTAGKCKGSPKACDNPPANTCKDATTLITYPKTGSCKGNGVCSYEPSEEACSHGCDQATHACKGDPCSGVTCVTPLNACYKSPGTCKEGKCDYELDNGQQCSDNDSCTLNDTCNNGQCAGSPMVCNSPPKNVCKDSKTLTIYTAPGSCSGGNCNYGSAEVPCDYGCDATITPNLCKGDPCASIKCETPPNDQCYTVPGICSFGKCTYLVKYGALCNDKNDCSHTDKCDANGGCAGVTYTCSDSRTCTKDTCDGKGGCTFPIDASSCLIPVWSSSSSSFVSTCFQKDASRVGNTCQYCSPTQTQTNWTAAGGTVHVLWAFDSGNLQGFTVNPDPAPPTGIKWQVDNKRADSAPYSLYFGRLSDHTFNSGSTVTGDATSPAVSLPASEGKLCLEFRMWKAGENYYSYDYVSIYAKPTASPTDAGVPPAETQIWRSSNEPGYGNSITFLTYSVNISGYAGQTVQFRINFNSVDSIANNYEGVYLDNIRVLKNCTP